MTHGTHLKISKSSTRRNLMNKSIELTRAKSYLTKTDYIVIKINEAVIKGQDTSELLSKYADQLSKRETYRNSIDALEVEVKTLEQEWREERARIIAEEFEEPVEELKTGEEAKNNESTEDVIEQPIEEIPTDTSEVVEGTTTEKVVEQPIEETTEVTEEPVTEVEPSEQPTNTPNEEVTEVDTTDQTIDNITDTNKSIEATPSEQPIKETPTEVVENLE